MAIHTLAQSQTISASLEECWSFFSDPRNLARLTPPSLAFELISPAPPEMYPGLMIEYRVRPLLGIRMTWLTEITQVERPRSFIDEQRIGPYRVWHHEHRFAENADGSVEMHDKVTYALPFGILSAPVHALVVRPQLRRIFAYRNAAVRELFP